MYKIFKLTFAFTPFIWLTGCSWQEYFVILNASPSAVTVQYTIAGVEKGFPIFTQQPVLYALNTSNDINWHAPQNAVDLDSSSTGLKIRIPANYAIVLGALNNDHYKAYNQNFINARVFNLEELEVLRNDDTLSVLPTNFDAFFKKKAGQIALEIK